jgi:hypothetical protein
VEEGLKTFQEYVTTLYVVLKIQLVLKEEHSVVLSMEQRDLNKNNFKAFKR